jgi:hypothetical protein
MKEMNQMTKKQLIQVFKVENLILGIFVSIVAIVMFFVSTEVYIKGMSVGMMVGLWIGVGINHFIKIPMRMSKKDERELMMMVVSNLIGTGAGMISLVLVLSFIYAGLLVLDPMSYILSVLLMAFTTFVFNFGSFEILKRVF